MKKLYSILKHYGFKGIIKRLIQKTRFINPLYYISYVVTIIFLQIFDNSFFRGFLTFSDTLFHEHIRHKKYFLIEEFLKNHKNEVLHGPFKGLNLGLQINRDYTSIIPLTMGVYEEVVTETIFNKSSERTDFIDIGAAYGYFSIGVLKSKLFNYTVAYEIDDECKKQINKLYRINKLKNEIKIFGEATESLIINHIDTGIIKPSKSFFLIDVEGFEFKLLTYDLLSYLKDAVILIEIHDFGDYNNTDYKKLIDRSKDFFDFIELRDNKRTLYKNDFLDNLRTDLKLLLLSESRSMTQKWVLLTPKSKYIEKDK